MARSAQEHGKKQKNVEMGVSGHTCMTVLVNFPRSLGVVLNSVQTRNAQASLNVPLPPFFGMSRQFLQSPQFSFLQPEHLPHLVFLLLTCDAKEFVVPSSEEDDAFGLFLTLLMGDSFGALGDDLALHFAFCARISQIFLNVPLPPFFGLSLQDLQFPQSSI